MSTHGMEHSGAGAPRGARRSSRICTDAWRAALLLLALLATPATHAVFNGEDDVGNKYPNVGAFMAFLKASKSLVALCSGTLIHPRIFLTAGHCAEGPTDGTTLNDYIAVVSFRNKQPRDAPDTWVPIVGALTHPSYPRNGRGGSLKPGESDVGVFLLEHSVKGIAPAPLPATGESFPSNTLMTVVGYGCTPGGDAWNGVRSFGGTIGTAVNGEWGQFRGLPANSCSGDSGGPILYDGRVMLLTSGGDNAFAYPARVDVPAVLSWLATVIESTGLAVAIEYYHASFDHYFVTANSDEIAKLDARVFPGWARTGQTFNVNTTAAAGLVKVCRFFTTAFPPTSSHFYAPRGLGCEATLDNKDWQFEADVFYTALPAADGSCPVGTNPVYRLYNNGQGGAPNHRFTTSETIRAQMLDKGYVAEGAGVGVGMCSPD